MSKWAIFMLISLILLSGFSAVSATPPPAKIVASVLSNLVSALVKWLWSLKSTTKTKTAAASSSGRSLVKFESGYSVETVFDGCNFGIEPYAVQVSPHGDLLMLDSENSNIHKISMPLSQYGRPKLVAGSPEGYTGHVDGKLKEARMNNPKGIAIDDRGNVYIADTMNMAIRKISDAGVTTIAGGKWSRGGGHVDGRSGDAKFSNDFDVVYIGSSCSLLVIDRGNQAIREIRLNDDDCSYQEDYDGSFHLGVVVLVAAAFLGYMLALLQLKVQRFFSRDDSRSQLKQSVTMAPYQRPPKRVRPPLIPDEDELEEKPEEGIFRSIGRLVFGASSSMAQLFGGMFTGSRKKPHQYYSMAQLFGGMFTGSRKKPHQYYQLQHQYQQQPHMPSKVWPVQMQESFVLPGEDEPLPPSMVDSRPPALERTYPSMTSNIGMKQNSMRQNGAYHSRWDAGDNYQQQQMQMEQKQQQQMRQHHHRQYSSDPQTYYENSCETNEIVFGQVQEQDGRCEAMVIKAVDYGDPKYNHHNIRSRINYMGYSQAY